MAQHDALFAALEEFVHTLSGNYAIGDVLAQLTDQLAGALSLTGAGVSVGDEHDQLRFVTASSDALIEVERTQEALQDGPCVDAFRSAQPVSCDDLTREQRWPQYTPAALASDFHAVAAVPLVAAERCIGSLNLYMASAHAWSDEDLRAAALFGEMAASYVTNASELQRSERIREQLQRALDSRIIIEQAKGLIAGQQHISLDDAYRKLRAYTRRHNAHLHDVANAIVNLGLRID